MSLSGLIAAKKRIEASIKKYDIPTTEIPVEIDSCKNNVLLLSLLQSRLNWANYVFPKYKADPVQQPKRTTTTRKKWPGMTYLGSCCLELGAHIFEDTCFYEAKRVESWRSIAKEGGLATEEEEELCFHDIVFELKEISNERFIFPKESIIEVISTDQNQLKVHASFILPIDQSLAEEFFDTPKNKIIKFGHSCSIKVVKDFIDSVSVDTPKYMNTYQPVNIRITNVNQPLIKAFERIIEDKDQVTNRMKEKLKVLSKAKRYIKFDLSDQPDQLSEIQDLIQKASTVPDIITGPIQAEKKRNEILNAIKLGKRPRDEKFEADLPKNKYMNPKEDGLLKCAYCSTKYTYMWRPGPGGQGTLCNSCGIQWKRGEILVDAPIISRAEEIQLLLEKKEKERAQERPELEKTEREIKPKKKPEKASLAVVDLPFAVQLLQQKSKSKTAPEPKKKPKPEPKKPQPVEQPKPVPLSLYSPAGIPLPTLSIDFAGLLQFSHPHCGITLLDRYFSVRLCKDNEQTTLNFEKSDLMQAQFEVVSEGESVLQREILRMRIGPEPKSILAFGQTFLIDQTRPIQIRFLEKLDPNGGAVVQRILQRWLVTMPQTSSNSQ